MVPYCRSDWSTQGTDEGNIIMAANMNVYKFSWDYVIHKIYLLQGCAQIDDIVMTVKRNSIYPKFDYAKHVLCSTSFAHNGYHWF